MNRRRSTTTTKKARRALATASAAGAASAKRAVVASARRRGLRDEIRAVILSTKEKKKYQGEVSAQAVSTSGYIKEFYKMAQGVGDADRIGDSCMPTKLEVDFQLGMGSGSDNWNDMRVIIVQCKVPSADVTTADFPTATGFVTDAMKGKYRVLYDSTETLNAVFGISAKQEWVTPWRHIELYGKKLSKMEWNSTTTTAVQADVKGAVKMYMVSTSGLSPHPTAAYRWSEYSKDE